MADETPNSDRPAAGGATSAAPAMGRAAARLDYAAARASRVHRGWSATRRWARDTFSREQLLAGLKQLMLVAPLTLLIWVYAEREQQVPARGLQFAVEVRSNNPKVDVRL